MNATPLLLILFLASTCHGEDQNNSPTSGILSRTNTREKTETSRIVTCPDPTDIEPCECLSDGYMDCSKVQDEEELRQVFTAVFPTTEFTQFIMKDNNGVKVLEDGVFGDVSFRRLDIRNCVLETVENDALTSSLSNLTHIVIQECQLATFPFERLAEFTSLILLGLFSNNMQNIPPLSSSSLKQLVLSQNPIANLSSDVFKLLPAVEAIFLYTNDLTEIENGTFTGLPNLYHLSLEYNKIRYLQSLSFELSSTSFPELYLDGNSIDTVEVDAFKGVPQFASITMNHNALTTLPEEVWRPVLEKNINVELAGNPLACGCDLAWLVRDPPLLASFINARCEDGTLLTSLDPADFDQCG